MSAAAVCDVQEHEENTGVHLTRRSAILKRLAALADRLDARMESERPAPPASAVTFVAAPPCALPATLPPPTLADVELAETIDVEPDEAPLH